MFHGLLKDSLVIGTYKHAKHYAKKSKRHAGARSRKQGNVADLVQAVGMLKKMVEK